MNHSYRCAGCAVLELVIAAILIAFILAVAIPVWLRHAGRTLRLGASDAGLLHVPVPGRE